MYHKTFKDLLRVPDIFIYLLNIYIYIQPISLFGAILGNFSGCL